MLCKPERMWRRFPILVLWLIVAIHARSEVSLQERYPTSLETGDPSPERARGFSFSKEDVFGLSSFRLECGSGVTVEMSEADLGIGHASDGAVWAVAIPRGNGKLVSGANREPEAIAHLWLRFHPREIERLFPAQTVFTNGKQNLAAEMRAIAGHKMSGSWQAGGRAMIPERKDLVVDIDTQNGARRFFVVDTAARTAEYVPAFASRGMRKAPNFSKELAEQAFDRVWKEFDEHYAMFVLRPEVDWAALRERHRPGALESSSAYEFAEVIAEMLRPLRDLHIWLKLGGTPIPVFDRPRAANANPRATQAILGKLNSSGRAMRWSITPTGIGYIAIHEWTDSSTPKQFDQILEAMRETHGLILDVRLNGGGNELLGREVAGRFIEKEFVYAFSQHRTGSRHGDLSEKRARKVSPRGPWRYTRPVLLLMGECCMSSNESYIGMMEGSANVTTMGARTCGSSGNPKIVELPMQLTVSVPQWIDYIADGTPLDERGMLPRIEFKPEPGAFSGNRDDLLKAALARLEEGKK